MPTYPLPDSFDVWIAAGDNPESCNKLLGTYRFTHPITVSNSTYSELTSCNSDDGAIILAGLIPNLSYSVSFEQNSAINTGLTITADSTGNITIGSLSPGLYSNISIAIDGCTNDSVGDVTIPEPVKPDIIAFSSGSNTDCASPNGSITIFSPTL